MCDPKHKVIGVCAKCKVKTENYVNCKDPDCNRHFIACVDCAKSGILCPMGCISNSKKQTDLIFK